MFSYFGSKSKIVDLYPTPKFNKIIEPFAGSARYSLKYWQKDITIIDKYDRIINIWLWLQKANANDILQLPNLDVNVEIPKYLSEPEYDFVSFNLHRGRAIPSNKTGKFSDCWNTTKKRVANDLFKIKHWNIKLADYTEIENENATWFIDPPYMFGGQHYKISNKNINYENLANWCKQRNGQVIVCENTKANWLPFKPVTKIQGQANSNTMEAIWSNVFTDFDYQMQSLF